MSETTHPALTPANSIPGAPAVAAAPASDRGQALKVLRLDVERLIDAYEIEVTCHGCQAVYRRSIGWLRVQTAMECAQCHATIVLRTSVMNEEMRRIARQLRQLEQQLAQMIERAVGILGQ